MTIRLQLRRDTQENWALINPILAVGEIGVEYDTKRIKVGDGIADWQSLSYTTDWSLLTNKPTILSAFTNDVGYITAADLPTNVSELANDTGYITAADLPTNVSELINDAGYISSFTESDPLFTASPAASIINDEITNWNTAYSWGDHATVGYATETYVDTAISNLVSAAPEALDTLNELAAALGDDSNFATTVTNQLSLKANTSDLATIATSGLYSDLTGTPDLSVYQLSSTAFDGNYSSLTGTPTTLSSFTNDAGYIASSQPIESLTLEPYQDVVTSGTTVTFTKTDNGSEVDVIDTNLSITRDAGQQGIYNSALESGPDTYGLSPEGTLWNADGWDDLSDVKTRNYAIFYKALDMAIGNVVIGRELVMFDTINNKYYKIKFSSWTQGGNGGGFSYERTLLNIAPGSQGITVNENKFIIDKTGSIKFSNQYSSNELVSVDLKINSSTLNLSVVPNTTVSWNNYLFISSSSVPRKIVVYDTITNQEIYSIISPDSSNGVFSSRISISNNYLITADSTYSIGASSTGRLYVYDLSSFDPNNSNFDPIYIIDNPNYSGSLTNDRFGSSFNIEGNYITSKGEDVVYVFDITTFTTSTISSANYVLTNPSGNTGDFFGAAIYLNDTYICVAADGADDNRNNSGKIYVYNISTFTTNIISSANFTIVPNSTVLGNNIYLYITGLINNNIFAYDSRNTVYRYDITTFTSNIVDTPTQIIRSYDPNYRYFGFQTTYNQNYFITTVNDSPGNSYVYKLSDILSTTTNVRPVITVPGYIRFVTNDNKLYTNVSGAKSFTVYDLNSIENSIELNLDSSTTITATNVVNWNSAYSWGDHSQQGYVVSPVSELEFANGTKQTTALNNNNVESILPLEINFPIQFKYQDATSGAQIGRIVLITDQYIITSKYRAYNNSFANIGKIFVLNKTTLDVVYTINNPSVSGTEFGDKMDVYNNVLVVGVSSIASNSGRVYVYNLDTFTSPEIDQPTYTLENPNPYSSSSSDRFGSSVGISNNYICVGAWGEDPPTFGGSSYIYDITTFTTSTITSPTYTLNNPVSSSANFGQAVTIFNNYVAIAAPNYNSFRGRIYLYDITTFTTSLITDATYIIEEPSLVANQYFGSYGLKMFSNYLVVGAVPKDSYAGGVYVYDITTFTTSTITSPTYTLNNPNIDTSISNDSFGSSVAMQGNYIAVGAPVEDYLGTGNTGITYLYDISTFTTSTITTPNVTLTYPAQESVGYFGYSVAMLNNELVIGAPRITTSNPGEIYYYNIDNFITDTISTADNSINNIISFTKSSITTKPRLYNNLLVVGASDVPNNQNNTNVGEVYVYNNLTNELLYTLKNPGTLPASDFFGCDVDIYGNYIIVGARGTDSSGVAYIYDITTFTTNTITTPTYTLTNPNAYSTTSGDNYGNTVGIYGNYAVVSAPDEDVSFVTSSGVIYIYDISTFTTSTITTANYRLECPTNIDTTSSNRKFGQTFEIFENYIVVGVPTATYQTKSNSGLVHLYDISTFTTSTITTPNNSIVPIPSPNNTTANNQFGSSVDISNNYIVIGAPGYIDSSIYNSSAGRVYVYDITTFTTSTISTPTYIIENPYISNITVLVSLNFGNYVSIQNNYIAISYVMQSNSTYTSVAYDITTFNSNIITEPNYVGNSSPSQRKIEISDNFLYVQNGYEVSKYKLFYSTNVNNVETINFANTTTNITASNVVNWNSAYSWGDHNAENYTKFSPVPLASTGTTGDVAGLISADSVYFYYCTGNYDGTTNIWKRTAWSNDTWQQLG